MDEGKKRKWLIFTMCRLQKNDLIHIYTNIDTVNLTGYAITRNLFSNFMYKHLVQCQRMTDFIEYYFMDFLVKG